MTYEDLKRLRRSPFWLTPNGKLRFANIYRRNLDAFRKIEAEIEKEQRQ